MDQNISEQNQAHIKDTNTVNAQLTEDDYGQFCALFVSNIIHRQTIICITSLLLSLFTSITLITMVGNFISWNNDLQSVITITLACILSIPFYRFFLKYAGKENKVDDDNNFIFEQKKVSINRHGYTEQRKFNTNTTQWRAITTIIEDDRSIYLFISKSHAFIIPKSSFANDEDTQTFYEEAQKYWSMRNNKITKKPWDTKG